MPPIDDAPFLRNLTNRQREKVRRLAISQNFQAGATIIALGQAVKHLYVIDVGEVRVLIPVDGQTLEEQTFATLRPGDTFGEFAFADRQPSSAAVIAETDTRVLALPHDDLDDLLDADPELARTLLMDLLRTIVERFRSTDASLALAHYVGHLV